MREEKKQISIDQFYAEKFENAEMQFDAGAGWKQLQVKKKKGWFSFKRLFTSAILLIAITTAFILFRPSSDAELRFSQNGSTSSTIQNAAKSTSKNVEGTATNTEFIEESKTKDPQLSENTTLPLQSKDSKEIQSSNSTESDNIPFGSQRFKSPQRVTTNSNTHWTDQKLTLHTKFDELNSPKNLNEKTQLSPNLLENQSNNQPYSSVKNGTPIPNVRSEIMPFGLLNSSSLIPLNIPTASISNETIKPFIQNNAARWSIDLGLTFGKEYELTSDFNLEESGIKVRLSHLALKYDHLRMRKFNTFAYLSFDKIYGEKEFVGDRIVRTYRDNNFSLGYGIQIALFERLDFETTVSIGISMIDKVEFEQQPTWVDGEKQYKEYTETSFKINPTITYQNHTKLSYLLSDNISLFTGIVYRSQFADRLSSSQIARENSLTTFSDLQFLTGISYNFN